MHHGIRLLQVLLFQAAVFFLAAQPVAAAPLEDPHLDNETLLAIKARFGEKVVAQRVAALSSDLERFSLPLTVDDKPLTFIFSRHSLRAPQFTVVEARGRELREIDSGPSLSFRGIARENPAISAALHFGRSNRISGIILSGEHTYGVESVEVAPLTPDDTSVVLALYESETDHDHAGCATKDTPHSLSSQTLSSLSSQISSSFQSSTPSGGAGASLVGGGLTLRIGALADSCFVNYEGGSQETIDEVEALYNAISLIYERDVQIRIELSVLVLELSSSTPCSQAQPAQQTLYNFGAQWPVQYPSLAPLAQNMQLLTGRPFSDLPTVIGMAHLNGICNSSAFSVNHVTYPNSTLLLLRAELLSHELGHNFSAQHCNGQPDCGIMYTRLNGGPLPYTGFGSSSINAISNYSNSLSCLTTSPAGLALPFSESFPRPSMPIPYAPSHPKWTHNMNTLAIPDSRSHISGNFSAFLYNQTSAGQPMPLSAELRTNYIDTRGIDLVYVTFEAKFPATATYPELQVRYLGSSGSWQPGIVINQQSALVGDYRQYAFVVRQSELQHDRFRLSFRAPLQPGNPFVYIDNIEVTAHPSLRSVTPRGAIVTPLDDLDGDGFDDYLKADPRSPAASNQGEVWFVSGKLNQERTFMLGAHYGAQFGSSIRSAGDINQDGVTDVVVGSPSYGGNPTQGGPGRVQVLSGRDIAQGNPYPQVLMQKTGTGVDRLGTSVEGGYDIDGDGTPDFVAGAPGANSATQSTVGCIYAWSGASGAALFTFCGLSSVERYGSSLEFLGPIDAGGHPALIAGVSVTPAIGAAGRAVLIERPAGAAQYTDSSSLIGTTATSLATFNEFGSVVAAAGDLDADGFRDILIGAPRGGVMCLPFGVQYCISSPGKVYAFSSATRQALFSLVGDSTYDRFGQSLSNAGDVDGDGISDILIGAPDDPTNGSGAGAAYLFNGYGKLLQRTYGFGGDHFGSGVAGRSDLNGDGHDELLVAGSGACTPGSCQGYIKQFTTHPTLGIPIEGAGSGLRNRARERSVLEIIGRKLTHGYRVTYQVRNAKPNSPIFVLTGFQVLHQSPYPGSTPVHYAEPAHIASGITDPDGRFDFDFVIPNPPQPVRLYHQAVEFDAATDAHPLGFRASGIVSALYD